ncbi:MAG: autotransporter outer membrane beta-barrel domain-containing protein [Rhodomicrobium sp.]
MNLVPCFTLELSTSVASLRVAGNTNDSDKMFLGVQFDTKMVLDDGWALTPYVRLSWEHEFSTDRSITASPISRCLGRALPSMGPLLRRTLPGSTPASNLISLRMALSSLASTVNSQTAAIATQARGVKIRL